MKNDLNEILDLIYDIKLDCVGSGCNASSDNLDDLQSLIIKLYKGKQNEKWFNPGNQYVRWQFIWT